MLKSFVCILSLIILLGFGRNALAMQQQDINGWRLELRRAIESKDVTDSLYNVLSNIKSKQPVVVAYIGALNGLKAKYSWNPYSKIKFINSAEDAFEQAVKNDPHNVEIRFLRFSVETNVPGFLHMDKNMDADKNEIVQQLQAKNYPDPGNKDLTASIVKFLIDSGRCSESELQFLNKQLALFK